MNLPAAVLLNPFATSRSSSETISALLRAHGVEARVIEVAKGSEVTGLAKRLLGEGIRTLVAAGGVSPSSIAYGVPRARFAQLGLRIAPSALLRPRLPASVPPTAAAFEVADGNRGLRTLRIRIPDARTVELSGDFTNWKPVALTRGATDQWEATLPIAPGMHRLAIRVNGDAWTPPPGITAVPDEFQGTVGVITVK